MSEAPLPVQAIVVNYQTPDLLSTTVATFRQAYPAVPLLIVDNGSKDGSRDVIQAFVDDAPGTVEALYLDQNVFHGPAMHLALERTTAPFAFILDSDTETLRPGFLEQMLALLEQDPMSYAAGHVVQVDRRGFAARRGIPVLSSAYMLLRSDVYRKLPPFVHHGLPALGNMKAACEQGYRLHTFPIEDYVHHLGRGTAARFGYGLGLRSRFEYLLHRLGL